jgi:hypothetical protein
MADNNRWQTKDVIEMVGIAAVVLSLLLLAYEVRQSNRIAQATTTYEINRDINQFNELGYSSAETAALLIKFRENSPLTDIETLQLQLMARRFLNLWTVQETAYENGLLTDEQIGMTKADVISVMMIFPALKNVFLTLIREQPELREFYVLQPLVSELSEAASTP